MDKKRHLATIHSEWANCKRCDLHLARRRRAVVGNGNPSARFLFIYDVPTESDTQMCEPMSGDEGVLFAELMTEAGVDHQESYCLPLLGCRPTQLIPKTDDVEERIVDRDPRKEELAACHSRVISTIYTIDPEVIFAVGDIAFKALVIPKDRGNSTTLDKALGNIFSTYVPGKISADIRYPVIPLPSIRQLIANPSVAKTGPFTVTIRELLRGKNCADYIKTQDQGHGKK
jgi:uracil-DNA glycosylase family 4